jgi:hypothetical protein
MTAIHYIKFYQIRFDFDFFGFFGDLMPLSAIFPLYHGDYNIEKRLQIKNGNQKP